MSVALRWSEPFTLKSDCHYVDCGAGDENRAGIDYAQNCSFTGTFGSWVNKVT